MVRFTLIILCILSTSANSTNVEVFYNGFWSHSPFPTSIERLQKTYSLKFSVHKSSIPREYLKVLFDGFKPNHSHSLQVSYVFYLQEKNSDGQLIKELAGGKNFLFDLTNNTYKRLSEIEKKLLNNYIKDLSCEKSDFLPYQNIDEL